MLRSLSLFVLLQLILLKRPGISITNDKKYNDFHYYITGNKFHCIFAWYFLQCIAPTIFLTQQAHPVEKFKCLEFKKKLIKSDTAL